MLPWLRVVERPWEMYHKNLTALHCGAPCKYFITLVWNSREIWGAYSFGNEESDTVVRGAKSVAK
jgi:hypothetical protein